MKEAWMLEVILEINLNKIWYMINYLEKFDDDPVKDNVTVTLLNLSRNNWTITL